LGAKKDPGTGFSVFCPREKWGESLNRKRGWRRGRKETLANKPPVFENRPFDLSRLSALIKMISVKF